MADGLGTVDTSFAKDLVEFYAKKAKIAISANKDITMSEEELTQAMVKEHNVTASLIVQRENLNKEIRDYKKLLKDLEKDLGKARTNQKKLGDELAGFSPTAGGFAGAQKNYDAAVAATMAAERTLADATKPDVYAEAISNRELLNNKINDSRKANKIAAEAQKEHNASLLDFGKRLDIAIAKIVTYRIAYGAFRAVVDGIRAANEEVLALDATFQDLRKVLDATDEQFMAMRAEAYRIGIVFGKTANDVAQGFFTFAQQGLNAEQSMQRMKDVLLLVSSSMFDTRDAVEGLTSLVNVFPQYIDNVTAAIDKWAAVQAAAPVTTADLVNAMKQVGPVANEVGISLDQLNGIVAAINAVTRKSGREIGNSLKTIFSYAYRPETVKALGDLGFTVLQTADDFRPLGDVLLDIRQRWDDLSDVERRNIAQTFGMTRRYQDFLVLMNNFDEYVKQTTVSLTSQGYAERAAQEEIKKLTVQLQSAKTAVSQLGVEISQKTLTPAIVWLAIQLAKAAQVIRDNIGVFTILGTIAAAISIKLLLMSNNLRKLTVDQLTAAAASDSLAKALFRLSLASQGALAGVQGATGTFVAMKFAISPIGALITALIPILIAWGYSAIKNSEANKKLEASIRGTKDALEEYRNSLKKPIELAISVEKQDALRLLTTEADTLRENLNTLQEEMTGKKATFGPGFSFTKKQFDTVNGELDKLREKAKTVTEAITNESTGLPRIITRPATDKELESLRALTDEEKKRFRDLEKEYARLNTKFGGKNIWELEDEALKKYEKDAIDTIAKLALKQAEILGSGTTGARPKYLSKYADDIKKSISRINEIDTIIAKAKDENIKFGEAFDPTITKLDILKREYDNLKGIEDNLYYDILANEANLADMQRENLNLQKEKGKDAFVYPLEEVNRVREVINKLKSDFAANKENIAAGKKAIEDTIPALEKYYQIQNQVLYDAQRQVALYDLQIVQHQSIGKGFQKLSSTRALDFTILKKVIQEEQEVLDLQQKKEEILLEAERIRKVETGQISDIKSKEEAVAKLKDIQLKYDVERAKINLQAVSQTQKYIENVQSELSSAFSSAFSKIPGNIVENKRQLKDIAKERKEVEKELADARKANDDSAILAAKNRLIELENDIKRLRPVWTDVFGDLGEIGIKRWGEAFANIILTGDAAQYLASGIVPESIKAAALLKQGIIDAANDIGLTNSGANAIFNPTARSSIAGSIAGITGGVGAAAGVSNIENSIELAGDNVASRWERALQSGGNLAAVAIVKAMGIGTGEVSNALGNFGALLGAAGGEQFLKGTLKNFAGPVGTILGSLLGAGIGSLFEKDLTPTFKENTAALNKNTDAVNNNSKIQELQRQFINAPTNFVPYALYGAGATGGGVNVVVNMSGVSNPTAAANEIVRVIDEAYSTSARRSQSKFNRFGR